MAERLNAPVLKTGIGESRSGVRIPSHRFEDLDSAERVACGTRVFSLDPSSVSASSKQACWMVYKRGRQTQWGRGFTGQRLVSQKVTAKPAPGYLHEGIKPCFRRRLITFELAS